ncbi:MAG: glycosyltransferase family 2 protein [Chitinophagales bacterium]
MITNNFSFSILIPSWNNLPFLKLCIESIQKNSSEVHQIIVHVNDGSDGTLEWLKSQKIDFTHSEENIGICKALNYSFANANQNYIVYMNDDMYVLPNWDLNLIKEIKLLPNNNFYLSATLLEPIAKGNPSVISPAEFGTDIKSFQEEKLLKEFESFSFEDWSGASWPPSLVHRDLWEKVNGYSEEFSPGFYSDPDFSMKLWNIGVRVFKGVAASRVYHFQSKSLARIVKNDGRKQFYEKWGITASFFDKYFIKKGQKFQSKLESPSSYKIFLNKLKVKFYRLLK